MTEYEPTQELCSEAGLAWRAYETDPWVQEHVRRQCDYAATGDDEAYRRTLLRAWELDAGGKRTAWRAFASMIFSCERAAVPRAPACVDGLVTDFSDLLRKLRNAQVITP